MESEYSYGDFLKSFIGRSLIYRPVKGPVIIGVLEEVCPEEGYAKFRPSIVPVYGDEMRLEKEEPTFVSWPPKKGFVIRPLRDGDLERMVESNNLRAREKKNE